MNEGVEEQKRLEAAGFGSDEITSWQKDTRAKLTGAGFSDKEADEYFGIHDPDMSGVKKVLTDNSNAAREANAPKEGSTAEPKQLSADESFLDHIGHAFGTGFQNSVSGLLSRGKLPDTVLPEDADTMARIASQVGQLAGDVPAMVAGAFAGTAAGAAVSGPGAPIGAVAGGGFGTFALPGAMRQVMIDHYKKGDIQTSKDFWERTSATFLSAMKEGTVGAATSLVGGKVGMMAADLGMNALSRAALPAASEVATMTYIGKGLEGQLPNAQDFTDGAILVAGLHAAGHVGGKLMDIYAKTGLKPEDVAKLNEEHPTIHQDLVSESTDIPKALEQFVEKPTMMKEETPPAPAPAAPADPNLPPTAQDKILSRVGEREKKGSDPLDFDKVYTNFVDKFDPIKVAEESLVGKGKKTETSAYEFARMANDYRAKVKHVFEKGTLDFKTLAVNGEGFSDIIKPFVADKAKIDGLKAFMISDRALELESRGITHGFDVEAAKEVVKNGKAEFGDTAKKLVDFQNRTLDYAKDAGLISEEAHAHMLEAGKSYVSFSRVLDPADSGSHGQGKSKPFKKLTGSELKIQDPFLSMMENTEAIYKAAESNRAASRMVDVANSIPNQTVIEKVKTTMKPVQVGESEVANFFKQQGIDADPESFNIFRPMENKNLAPGEFEVMRNGKREVYKTSPELADALNRLQGDAGSMNLAMKIANGITAFKKVGITFTPDFILKNVFRDQLTAGVFSEGGSIPFKDIFGAMGDIIGKKDVYYDWLKSGGAGGAFLEMDKHVLNGELLKLSSESGMADKVYNLVKTPVEYMKLAGNIMEEGTRLAEFKRVTKGATEGPVMFKGGMASREVTVDFQRIGAKMSAVNAITAFQNVAIQGLDRTARAVHADPIGATAKGLMYLTAPSIALWWANKDDERYKEIPRWQKDLFWIIPTDSWQPAKDANEVSGMPKHLVRQKEDGSYEVNKGIIYRLPKPQELGLIFSTIPERMMEKFFTDNPRATKDLGETMKGLITPNLIPDAALPLAEQFSNKNFFTSAPLVSPQMEGRLSELQYTEYTSETAKALGKIIGQIPMAKDIGPDSTKINSPAVIDNYIKSWTGALGTYAVQVADKALEKTGMVKEVEKAAWTVADIPIIKAFTIRHPSASAQSIQDFYSRNTESEKVFKSIEFLAKSGDEEGIKKITDNPDYQAVMFKTGGIKAALGQMSSVIRAINANPKMHKDEKRQQIDTIYYQMQETAKYGNKMMDEWEKSLKK